MTGGPAEGGQTIYALGSHTTLLTELLNANCRFLVIGGVAVSFYCPERIPDDLDILIDNTRENAQKICTALAEIHIIPPSVEQLMRPSLQVPLKIRGFYADLLTSQPGINFDDLWESRVYGSINNLSVPFVSKNGLIELKLFAVNSLGVKKEKHQRDLSLLGHNG